MFDEIFYSECIQCGSTIDYKCILCDNCTNKIRKVSFRCKRCGYPLNVEAEMCKNCIDPNYYDKLFIPFWYSGVLKVVLKGVKFRYNIKGYKLISDLVKRNLFKMDRYDIITSVPSTFFRRFRRFVHPSEYVAKLLSNIYNIPYESLLKRCIHTEYQWKLKKKDRFKNIENAFIPKREIFDLKILLVDDIMTTGATINECSKILKYAGAKKVDCYILSKGLF